MLKKYLTINSVPRTLVVEPEVVLEAAVAGRDLGDRRLGRRRERGAPQVGIV